MSVFLLILSIALIFLGYVSLSAGSIASLWCSVVLVVLIWFIYWQKTKYEELKKEIEELKEENKYKKEQ